MGRVQHRLRPHRQGVGHVDDDVVEIGAGDFHDLLDVGGADEVERQKLGRRREHEKLLVEGQQRLQEGIGVHRGGVRKKLEDRFPARQVEIGGDRAELEVEVEQADPRRVLVW